VSNAAYLQPLRVRYILLSGKQIKQNIKFKIKEKSKLNNN